MNGEQGQKKLWRIHPPQTERHAKAICAECCAMITNKGNDAKKSYTSYVAQKNLRVLLTAATPQKKTHTHTHVRAIASRKTVVLPDLMEKWSRLMYLAGVAGDFREHHKLVEENMVEN